MERVIVKHPPHYTKHPSGVECIEITENMTFNVGNAAKYIWRNELKHDDKSIDLEKAMFYLDREIDRIESGKTQPDKITAKVAAVEQTSPPYIGKSLFALWLATLDPHNLEHLREAKRHVAAELASRRNVDPI